MLRGSGHLIVMEAFFLEVNSASELDFPVETITQ